jgi:hypothetical protein
VNPTWPDASTVVRILFPVGFLASDRDKRRYSPSFNTWHSKRDVAKGRSRPFRARNRMTAMARTAVVPEAASAGAPSAQLRRPLSQPAMAALPDSRRQVSANTGQSPTAWRTGQSTKATFAQASGECHGRVRHDAHHNG